jgi:predicted ATP-grasp superfamily ATP-dependent carboligase
VWAGIGLVGVVVGAFYAGSCRGSARVRGGIVLATASTLWLVTNKPAEIGVLIYVQRHHGVSVADIAGLVGLGLAAWCIWTGWRQ